MSTEIGDRVREALRRVGLTQRRLAADVGMSEDAMSNAINGKRSFAASELALIAPRVQTSVDWLIGGTHGQFEPKLSARHTYAEGFGHAEHDWAEAKNAVADVVLAYQQVGFGGTPVPVTEEQSAVLAARAARARLVEVAGERFVDDLPSAIELVFGVHVFVLGAREAGHGSVFVTIESDRDDAYAGEVNGQQFIVVSAGGAWFRKNFALAHELAHLLAGDPEFVDKAKDARVDEIWANAFASELLMPAELIRQLRWVGEISEQDVVQRLLELGVSTQALSISVRSKASVNVRALQQSTIPLVRRWAPERLTQLEATYRRPRFPVALVAAHERAVEERGLAPDVLAWMTGVSVSDLMPTPLVDADASSLGDLADELGLG